MRIYLHIILRLCFLFVVQYENIVWKYKKHEFNSKIIRTSRNLWVAENRCHKGEYKRRLSEDKWVKKRAQKPHGCLKHATVRITSATKSRLLRYVTQHFRVRFKVIYVLGSMQTTCDSKERVEKKNSRFINTLLYVFDFIIMRKYKSVMK